MVLWRGPQDGNIVSYNPFQLCAHQGHVHVTAVSGARAIPYICKYLGKGDTCARAAIISERKKRREQGSEQPVDIGLTYMKHRMVSYSEALVRFLEAPLVRRWPAVATVKVIPPRQDVMKKVRHQTSLHPPCCLCKPYPRPRSIRFSCNSLGCSR